MTNRQAVKLLKAAGFVLAKTRACGGQLWRQGSAEVFVPNRSQVEESPLRRALRHAAGAAAPASQEV